MRKYIITLVLLSLISIVFIGCNNKNTNNKENITTVNSEASNNLKDDNEETSDVIEDEEENSETRYMEVYEINGEAHIIREGKEIENIEKGTHIFSYDNVSLETGEMTLKLDDDKYIYVEQGAEFEIEISGTAQNSITVVTLLKGAITNEIQNKLSEESSYMLNTPNTTMSVKGTVYRAEIKEVEGNNQTKITVFDGVVQAQKISDDGIQSETVSISCNEEIVFDKNETEEVRTIDYSELSQESLHTIKTLVENGRNLDVDKEEIDKNIKEESIAPTEPETPCEDKNKFTITFMDGSYVFGTQYVDKGECAKVPKLRPSAPGEWDWDFSQKITEDIVIQWKYW